jgi:hypothetical protein
MQARATQERTLQSKKEEAYSNTLRNLLKVQNRRDLWTEKKSGQWEAHITDEGLMIVYPDMVEAQFWVSALTIYCSEDQRETIQRVSSNVNNTVADFVSGDLFRPHPEQEESYESPESAIQKQPESDQYITRFNGLYETILACAREDIGASYTD